jgi:hypothetical protein
MAFANPTDAFTKVDLDAFIPEVWSPIIRDLKYASMSIMNFATNLSYLLDDGGDIIHVPNIYTNAFTVQTQTVEGNGVVDQSPAAADSTLTVDTHKYIAFVIGDKTMKQMIQNEEVSRRYAEQARNLLVKTVEDSIFALYTSLTPTAVGSTTLAVTDLDIRAAIATMTSTDGTVFEMEDLAFFFDNTVYWNQVLGIAKYYDKSKSDMNPIRTGKLNYGADASRGTLFGELYGIPVYVTPRVVKATSVAKNMLVHRDAFAFATHTQGKNGIRVQSQYLLTNLATLTVVDIIYGVGILRTNAGVVINALQTQTTNG